MSIFHLEQHNETNDCRIQNCKRVTRNCADVCRRERHVPRGKAAIYSEPQKMPVSQKSMIRTVELL